MGPLSRPEAAQLLLETAGLLGDEAAADAGGGGVGSGGLSEVPGVLDAPEVVEIVDLCGRLPLAVAIAGGAVFRTCFRWSRYLLGFRKTSRKLSLKSRPNLCAQELSPISGPSYLQKMISGERLSSTG